MKRFLFSLIFAFCLCSCNLIDKQYYITLSVDTDNKNMLFIQNAFDSGKNHFETSVNTTFYLNYFLLPLSDNKIDIQDVYSSNPDIIAIKSIDETSKTIEAITLKTGEAKITIKTKKYGSSTSLYIQVN